MVQRGHACEIACRPVQAGNEPKLDRVAPYPEDDRNRRGRRFCCKCRRSTAGRGNRSHPTTNQIGSQCRQSIVVALSPAVFDRNVPALDVTRFAQALVERSHTTRPQVKRFASEKPNHRHCRLLRARSKRPRSRRTAKKRDELAPSHATLTRASGPCNNVALFAGAASG